MHCGSNEHIFLDISSIDCRDTNISFSVQHILNNDYYAARKQPQKMHTASPQHPTARLPHTSKKPSSVIKPQRRPTKGLQRESRQPSKNHDTMQEKETEDGSQTVKIAHCKSSNRQLTTKKVSKGPQKVPSPIDYLASNKIPLCLPNRSRSKSNISLHSKRTCSQVKYEGTMGKAVISSNISLTRTPSLDRIRSEANGIFAQQVKAKNQHIIRNDYFDERTTEVPKKQQKIKTIVSNDVKKAGKKTKKEVNIKSPRLKK